MRNNDACAVPLSFSCRVIERTDQEAVKKCFDHSSFVWADALPAFRHLQRVYLSASFCLGCFHYFLDKGEAKIIEAFTVRSEKRDTKEKLSPSEADPKILDTWLLENYFRYREADSVLENYRDRAPSP